MQYIGTLNKMKTEYNAPIQYYLVFENEFINLNQVLNKKIKISFKGYECLSCQSDQPIFRQGFCKSCFYNTPQAGDWIMRPELSTAHLNIEDRNLDYEKQVQLQPHIVYLANSSNLKVGVTRKSQLPTRWIDQGAHEALELVEVPNRYLAGITEVALKEFVADKTNWRNMLTNTHPEVNLLEAKQKLLQHLPKEVEPYIVTHAKPIKLEFPVLEFPQKVKSLNLDKNPIFEGVLKGIKGQYLIFEDQTVFNIRSNEGYVVELLVAV